MNLTQNLKALQISTLIFATDFLFSSLQAEVKDWLNENKELTNEWLKV